MNATTTKLTSSCTKLDRDGIIYYFLPHITIIVKNNIITVQSSSQFMLLERLTTAERYIYNIDFATLDTADKFGQVDSEGLVEYWILNDYFAIGQQSYDSTILTYYTGVEAGNPSGATDNIKFIDKYNGATLALRQTLSYNSANNIISIINV